MKVYVWHALAESCNSEQKEIWRNEDKTRLQMNEKVELAVGKMEIIFYLVLNNQAHSWLTTSPAVPPLSPRKEISLE